MVPIIDDEITMLVNKDNLLDEFYVPQDLVLMDHNENNFHNYFNPNLKPMLSQKVLPYFYRMLNDAKKDEIYLAIGSGYRSYKYQEQIWHSWVEKKGLEYTQKYVAPPGASEHQTGLAFDIACFRKGIFFDELEDTDEEINWLKENAYKYGFILRYPKGKENITGYSYEPWHYRYVGRELATYLSQNNLTLEEYYLSLKSSTDIAKKISL